MHHYSIEKTHQLFHKGMGYVADKHIYKFKDFSEYYWKFETNQLFVDNLDLTNIQKRQYFDYINWLPNNLLVSSILIPSGEALKNGYFE